MFNIGVYMGWADLAPDGVIPYHTLTAAYVGATMWTVTYETVYQHQDKVDDVKIGMKSLAILCGRHDPRLLRYHCWVRSVDVMGWLPQRAGNCLLRFRGAFGICSNEGALCDGYLQAEAVYEVFLAHTHHWESHTRWIGCRCCCSPGHRRNPSLNYHVRLYY